MLFIVVSIVTRPSKPRAAAERPSSPAAESRSEERAQAVGGRVQRLVVPLFETLN